jgi:hypothetical protein
MMAYLESLPGKWAQAHAEGTDARDDVVAPAAAGGFASICSGAEAATTDGVAGRCRCRARGSAFVA